MVVNGTGRFVFSSFTYRPYRQCWTVGTRQGAYNLFDDGSLEFEGVKELNGDDGIPPITTQDYRSGRVNVGNRVIG